MGGKNKGQSQANQAQREAGELAKKQFEFGEARFEEISPIRDLLIGGSFDFLNDPGGFNVAASPLFAPAKSAIEGQFQGAKEGLLATLPAGGTLAQGFIDLEGQKARGLTDIMSQIFQTELAQAQGFAGNLGPAIQSMQGGASNLVSSAGMAQQAAAQQTAAQSQLLGEIGMTGAMLVLASSVRYKDILKTIPSTHKGIDIILFNYNDEAIKEFGVSDKPQVGFIAEQVAEIYPECVIFKNGKPDMIKYGELFDLMSGG